MENTPVDTGAGTPPTVETDTPSGLPSDVKANEVNLDGFTFTPEFIAENFKDGKLKGRFGSVEEVLAKLKEAEDFKANAIREKTDAEKAQEQQQTEAQKQAQMAQAQQDTIMSLVPAFIENNMELTPEMETAATEAGIDLRDLKLGALELKERLNKAHSVVGGAEEYNAMLEWGKANMTDAQKAVFDKDVTGNMSEYAIKGLYADYQKAASADGYMPERIEGDGTPRGLQPYRDRRELYADRDYLKTPAGKRDKAAQANYKRRLNITPDNVLGI